MSNTYESSHSIPGIFNKRIVYLPQGRKTEVNQRRNKQKIKVKQTVSTIDQITSGIHLTQLNIFLQKKSFKLGMKADILKFV